MLPDQRTPDDDVCPVGDDLFAELYRASKLGLPALVATVSPDIRAMLALFCYHRSHLYEMGLAIAASCDEDDLVESGGRVGAALFARSREAPNAEPVASYYTARRKITLATGFSREMPGMDGEPEKEINEAVVTEVVPDVLSLGEIQRVLQSLLSEGVSIRDLGAIVESVGDKARITRDPSLLAEYARQALGRAITAPHLDPMQTLRVITLDPTVEQELATSITQTSDGEYLAMEPTRAQAVLTAVKGQSDQASARGGIRPVLLCSARVRRHVRRLLESSVPHLPVCSYNEVAPGISVETIGVVSA